MRRRKEQKLQTIQRQLARTSSKWKRKIAQKPKVKFPNKDQGINLAVLTRHVFFSQARHATRTAFFLKVSAAAVVAAVGDARYCYVRTFGKLTTSQTRIQMSQKKNRVSRTHFSQNPISRPFSSLDLVSWTCRRSQEIE